MSDNIKEIVYLIGTGYMAIEYSKVLDELKLKYEIIGRGKESAEKFEEITGKKPTIGGVNKWLKLKNYSTNSKVIVAVGVEQLAHVVLELLKSGFSNILIEKPAGLNFDEIKKVADETKNNSANVYVAYNRRFYASVIKAKEIIAEDGGVTSFNFEFTEWSHEIEKLDKAPGVKENWFLANSTHVVDLAFYLGGKPKEISCYTSGGLRWHPSASIFSGAGISDKNALFSYQANWESAGRWSVEVLTKHNRFIFRPMERLQIQKRGEISQKFVNIDYTLDEKYNPGLFLQTKYFLDNNTIPFCTIEEQLSNINIYKKMANY